MEVKISTVCRVCLNLDFDGKVLSLFEKYNDCIVSDQINALTTIDIKEGDGLPVMICSTCLSDLEKAFNFKLKCENSNKILMLERNVSNRKYFDSDPPIKKEYLDIDDVFNYTHSLDTITDVIEKCHSKFKQNGKKVVLECHDCSKLFSSKCKIRTHWKKVHFLDALKCHDCHDQFKSYVAFHSHKKKNTCAIVSKSHIIGEGKNRVFKCRDCNYQTNQADTFISHVRVHTGEKPFTCDICQISFSQHSTLSSHKEFVHQIYTTVGTCPFCGKFIKGKTRMYKHMATHKYTNGISCMICGSVLKSKKTYDVHMIRHRIDKKFVCDTCSLSFHFKTELIKHLVTHDISKHNKCDLCGYTSISPNTMARHKIKHTVLDFACNVCGFFTDCKKILTVHKKQHTERNFKCYITGCDKAYFSKRGLNAHLKKKHGMKPEMPETNKKSRTI